MAGAVVPLDDLAAAVGAAADPDLAAGRPGPARAGAAAPADLPAFRAALVAPDGTRERLVAVLGASAALATTWPGTPSTGRRWPATRATSSRPSAAALRAELLGAVGGPPGTASTAQDALRVAYRRRLLSLAARDLSGAVSVEDVAGELADLAAATLDAALAMAQAELPDDAEPVPAGGHRAGQVRRPRAQLRQRRRRDLRGRAGRRRRREGRARDGDHGSPAR